MPEQKKLTDFVAPTARQLARRRGNYGFDAPYVPVTLALIGLCLLVPGILLTWVWPILLPGLISLCCGLYMLLSAAGYVYTTRRGKFRVWAEILTNLHLHGDEQIVDFGCGRGAVLLMAASLVPAGRATGVDLWRTVDQSGNALATTRHNAALEGVADQVELCTADMRKVPFAAQSFDVLLSSIAIHNIPTAEGREEALAEAARVLRPGGRLAIADIRNTEKYAQILSKLGLEEATQQRLGWRFWFGSPWVATRLVTARKPL